MSSPYATRYTILTATLTSAWLCGGLSSISLLGIPALAESTSNDITIRQFTKMYAIGRLTQPPVTLLTALLFFYTAWKSHNTSKIPSSWRVLAGAGVSVLGVLGFTYVVLEPTSRALMDMVHYHDIKRNDGQEEKELLKRWGVLNGVRAVIAGLATGLGAWALIR